MIVLEPTRLHWISDDGLDDPEDLCAHSPVRLAIENETIISPEDGDWAVSTSALYLLRTLSLDRTPVDGDQLFPDCGHVFSQGKDGSVFFIGCPQGIDFAVRHVAGHFEIELLDGRKLSVPEHEWRAAVIAFSDRVAQFYAEAGEKQSGGDPGDASAFQAFKREWHERRQAAEPRRS